MNNVMYPFFITVTGTWDGAKLIFSTDESEVNINTQLNLKPQLNITIRE
jgi:hypothetical protein